MREESHHLEKHLLASGDWTDLWCALILFLVVMHMFVVRPSIGLLLITLVPPSIALGVKRSATARGSSKTMAGIFLTLIGLADLAAMAVPKLGRDFPMLPHREAIILDWYFMVYLGYGLGVFPLVLFVRPLIDRYKGRSTYFSPFTCWIGLVGWLAIGPVTLFWLLPMLLFGNFGR